MPTGYPSSKYRPFNKMFIQSDKRCSGGKWGKMRARPDVEAHLSDLHGEVFREEPRPTLDRHKAPTTAHHRPPVPTVRRAPPLKTT